jgi:hypothetical protein
MMPNIIKPQYKILPTANSPTAATIVAVVTATLNAGAVPATPMIIDSIELKVPVAKFGLSTVSFIIKCPSI